MSVQVFEMLAIEVLDDLSVVADRCVMARLEPTADLLYAWKENERQTDHG